MYLRSLRFSFTIALIHVVEYREIFGVVFSQKRNDVLFTKDHLKKVVTANKELPASVSPAIRSCSVHLKLLIVYIALYKQAIRDRILASIVIKYTQYNSVGYAVDGQMIGKPPFLRLPA